MCRWLRQASFVKIWNVLFVLGLLGCGVPSQEARERDFYAIARAELPPQAQVTIASTFVGEGDGGNFYQHFVFDVFAEDALVSDRGWLAQRGMPKGARRSGELVVLYRKAGKSWRVVSYELVKPLQ